jgi:nucleoside-diphosphate-sugar epimerase
LVEVEQLLLSNKNFETTILRFGGLIGEDRHPIKFLAGRENLENPEAPINLIHQEDCIGIIGAVLDKNCWNETFNAVAPQHPTRQEYYHKKAENLKLPFPNFAKNLETKGKLISSTKVETVLHYSFRKKV